MEWVIKFTPFVTPLFIVWRIINGEKKGRVVADLRAINCVAILNNYPLLSQDSILNCLIGKEFIIVLDVTVYFY